MSELKSVEIYTAVWMHSSNPGLGTYAIILAAGKHRRELSGGYRRTSRERLALTALALALESLKVPVRVRAMTPAIQVADLLANGRAARWRDHHWQPRSSERIENADLWERVLKAADPHQLSVVWDTGEESTERARAYELAQVTIAEPDLLADSAFELLSPKAPDTSQLSLL